MNIASTVKLYNKQPHKTNSEGTKCKDLQRQHQTDAVNKNKDTCRSLASISPVLRVESNRIYL